MGNGPAATPDGHKGSQHLGSIQEPLYKGFLKLGYKILPKCDLRHLCPFLGLTPPKPGIYIATVHRCIHTPSIY